MVGEDNFLRCADAKKSRKESWGGGGQDGLEGKGSQGPPLSPTSVVKTDRKRHAFFSSVAFL